MIMSDLNYRSFSSIEENYYKNGSVIFLNLLNRFGLKATDKVLDIGCGSLRVGKHLIPFLKESAYCGIEPEEKFLTEGIKWELSQRMIDFKKPKFSSCADFCCESFNESFDLALASYVFVSCARNQLKTCLINLKNCLSKDGKFLFHVRFGEQSKHMSWEEAKEQKIEWYENKPYRFSNNMRTIYSVDDLDEILNTCGFERTRVFCDKEYKIKMHPFMTWVEAKVK
tara:strand:- start:1181 stop:1858 length:678 start_codon:yes stop_codon:yes gene_type:complete